MGNFAGLSAALRTIETGLVAWHWKIHFPNPGDDSGLPSIICIEKLAMTKNKNKIYEGDGTKEDVKI